LFADRDVLLLDHDRPNNPSYIRRFHDELVQIGAERLLATSRYRVRDRCRFCAFLLY